MDNKVLWNNEMNLCIGLTTEMDLDDFEAEAVRTHVELTGDILHPEDYEISCMNELVWRLDVL